MGLKSGLTPLTELPSLNPQQREKLRGLSITTVEELVGLLRAEPAAVRDVLELDERAVQELGNEAWSRLRPEMRELLERPVPRYEVGAQDPRQNDEAR